MTDYEYADTLRPLRGEVVRRTFATVDIESKNGDTQEKGLTRPFLAGYYDGSLYRAFEGPDCLTHCAQWMLSRERDGMVYYAHNGGNFDWLHFLPVIKALGYWFEVIPVGSSIMALRVKESKDAHHKGWTFLDSVKLIPAKLSQAAKSFGVEVTKDSEFDLDTHEKDPLWREYNRRDCVSLYQVLERFHDLVEIRLAGEVGITAASTAMKTFRRRYQSRDIERHSDEHEFFREAYYGGRVERFLTSANNLRYWDINSCYPWAMQFDMPVGNAIRHGVGWPSAHTMAGRIGFVRARVDVPLMHIAPLPHRDASTGRLTFPVGRFEGVWDYAELQVAMAEGAKVYPIESVWIQGAPVLRDMVTELYAYRDKSRPDHDPALDATAKLLMNSIYGRFAMAAERETIVVIEPGEPVPENSRSARPRDPDCLVHYVTQTVQSSTIVPQIAAHVTTLARLRLREFLKLAESRGTLAYCDTDSIITTADLSDHAGDKLGMLKDEGKGVTYDGEFLLPKLYALKGSDGSAKVAMKGFGTRDLETFAKVKRGETVSFDALEKLGSMAARGFVSGPQMRAIKKSLQSDDTKRITLDNGRTSPLVLADW